MRDASGFLARRIAEQTTEIDRESIDLLVTASCTGFQIPSMDGALIAALELSPNVRRVNLTEHGCAAGAAGIGIAHEWLASRPFARALVVCIELCSLAFVPQDLDEENLVSAAIFGDGAAAVLLAGECAETSGPKAPVVVRIEDTFREIFAGTEHFMGYEVRDEGFKIKLARDVVPFCSRFLPEFFSRVLGSWSLSGPDAFSIGAVHPGGRRVLEALEGDVHLPASVTRTSWETLKHNGNMSSVTVLAALDRMMRDEDALVPGARGLLSAFGPGFSGGARAARRDRGALSSPPFGVVGGGLAGLAAAIGLAKRGREVIVWESGDAGRDKVCGEFLSPEAEDDLEALGASGALHEASPAKLRSVAIFGPRRRARRSRPARPLRARRHAARARRCARPPRPGRRRDRAREERRARRPRFSRRRLSFGPTNTNRASPASSSPSESAPRSTRRSACPARGKTKGSSRSRPISPQRRSRPTSSSTSSPAGMSG